VEGEQKIHTTVQNKSATIQNTRLSLTKDRVSRDLTVSSFQSTSNRNASLSYDVILFDIGGVYEQ